MFNNLAAADPYYVMPMITALSMLATIEVRALRESVLPMIFVSPM